MNALAPTRRVRHQSLARFVVNLVNQLHGRRRQPGSRPAAATASSASSRRRARMQRMRLGNHRIARGDCRGEVAAGGAVERERKIIRAEHHHRPDRLEARADLVLRVDGRQRPRALERRLGRLPQLSSRPRQLDVGQPRRRRQCGFEIAPSRRARPCASRGARQIASGSARSLRAECAGARPRAAAAALSAASQSSQVLIGYESGSRSPVAGFTA